MAKVTPLVAVQVAAQSTLSTEPVDCSCETPVLDAGVGYMVTVRAQNGGTHGSLVCRSELWHGTTVISEMGQETATTTGLPVGQRGGTAGAFKRVTGNGTDTLRLRHYGSNGNTLNTQAMTIVAIPMTEFGTEGVDYFHDDTGSDVINAQVGGWDRHQRSSFALPGTQDWLFFASNEGTPGSGDTMASMCRFMVDGVQVGSDYHREREDTTDRANYAVAWLLEGLSGTVNFDIEVASRATAEADFYRPDIWAVRRDHWDQVMFTEDTAGDSTASETSVPFAGLNTTFTPNQSEFVLAIATLVPGSPDGSTGLCSIQLRNDTDGTDFNVGAGSRETDAGFDADRCQTPHLLVACEEISTAKDYQVRFKSQNNAATVKVGMDPAGTTAIKSGFLLWGLTTVDGGDPPAEVPDASFASSLMGASF